MGSGQPDSNVPAAPTLAPNAAQCFLVPSKQLILKVRSLNGKFGDPLPLASGGGRRYYP